MRAPLKTLSADLIIALIRRLVRVQKRTPPSREKRREWASRRLAPLFAEMNRRERAGKLTAEQRQAASTL